MAVTILRRCSCAGRSRTKLRSIFRRRMGSWRRYGQRRIPGTKIVNRQVDAELAQAVQRVRTGFHVFHQHGFGQLDLQKVGRQLLFAQDVHDLLQKLRVARAGGPKCSPPHAVGGRACPASAMCTRRAVAAPSSPAAR